jgi:hypothetical protein
MIEMWEITSPSASAGYTLLMDAKRSPKVLVLVFQTTRRHIPVDLGRDIHRPGNPKSDSFLT